MPDTLASLAYPYCYHFQIPYDYWWVSPAEFISPWLMCWHRVQLMTCWWQALELGIGIGFKVLALCSGCFHCVRGVCSVFKVLPLWSCHWTHIAIYCYCRTVVGPLLSQCQGVNFLQDKGGQRGGKGKMNSQHTTWALMSLPLISLQFPSIEQNEPAHIPRERGGADGRGEVHGLRWVGPLNLCCLLNSYCCCWIHLLLWCPNVGTLSVHPFDIPLLSTNKPAYILWRGRGEYVVGVVKNEPNINWHTVDLDSNSAPMHRFNSALGPMIYLGFGGWDH